jgi:hypothetical protein
MDDPFGHPLWLGLAIAMILVAYYIQVWVPDKR